MNLKILKRKSKMLLIKQISELDKKLEEKEKEIMSV